MNDLERTLDALVTGAPVHAADWSDVVARANAPRRRRMSVLALTAAVITAVVVTPAFGIGSRLIDLFSGTPIGSDQLSAQELHLLSAMADGGSPRVPSSDQQNLARFQAASPRRIAVRDDRAYYVADLRGGGLCVSIGHLGGERLLGSITCSPDFPSPGRPILDESTFTGPIDQPQITRFEGFAADGVASVGIVTADGALTAAPVQDNVYVRTNDLPTSAISAFVALDEAGTRIYSVCFSSNGCGVFAGTG